MSIYSETYFDALHGLKVGACRALRQPKSSLCDPSRASRRVSEPDFR